MAVHRMLADRGRVRRAVTTDHLTAPRGVLALLADRTYGPFFAGKVLSSCGIWVQNISAAVLMFDLTGSAVMVGAVSGLQFAGPLLFALWAGALTDRLDRRMLLVAGRMISTAAVGMLAALLWLGGAEGFGGPPVLLGAVFVMGAGLAVSAPAMQAIVPALVPDEDLERALALSSGAPSVARTVGPALGAMLLVVSGPGLGFAVAASMHFMFILALLAIRDRGHQRPSTRPPVLGGLRYLLDDRKAGMLMLGVAMLSFGADPVMTLTPPLAEQLGGDSGTVGLFAATFGLGAVLLMIAFGQVRRVLTLRWSGISGFGVLSLGLLITAMSSTVALAAIGFLVAGTGLMLGTVSLNTRIQRRVPDELRGRVMALWSVAFLGSRPVAAMVNGFLADLVSLQVAFLVSAGVVGTASLLARVSYGDRQEQAA